MTAGPQEMAGRGKALFLDRDGVINEEVGYLCRMEDVRFVPGIFSLCRTARRHGYSLVVVTNQSGIGRGLYSEAEFHLLMESIGRVFEDEQASLDGVYFCPFHPEHGIGAYRREHEDRKPGAGMLHRSAGDLHLDLAQSLLVGDRCSDIGAANAAGLRQAFLLGGLEADGCAGACMAVPTLSVVEDWLVSQTAR